MSAEDPAPPAEPDPPGERPRTGEPPPADQPDPSDGPAPTGEGEVGRRRRRAVGGTAPHADPEPLLPDRAPDDRDEAWDDRSSDDDERHLREVPPHW